MGLGSKPWLILASSMSLQRRPDRVRQAVADRVALCSQWRPGGDPKGATIFLIGRDKA